jgi:thioredoxin reductase (NADPH)
MYDAIIIGAGPAGISASLYLKRANKNVLVLYHGESELEKAHRIENYYGFPNGITGANLYQNGISQAKALGVDVLGSEVLSILMKEKMEFNVKTIGQEYQAKVIILATGNKKLKPNIKGVEEYEGRGISYCAICDGFFYRKKPVVVIGSGNYAISEAT